MCRLQLVMARANNDDADDADDGDDDVGVRKIRLTAESPSGFNSSFLAEADEG